MSYLKQFTLPEILDAIDISIERYYCRGRYSDEENINEAWNKVGGICYNRRKDKEDGNI